MYDQPITREFLLANDFSEAADCRSDEPNRFRKSLGVLVGNSTCLDLVYNKFQNNWLLSLVHGEASAVCEDDIGIYLKTVHGCFELAMIWGALTGGSLKVVIR